MDSAIYLPNGHVKRFFRNILEDIKITDLVRNFLGLYRITWFSLHAVKYVVTHALDGNEKASNGKVSISKDIRHLRTPNITLHPQRTQLTDNFFLILILFFQVQCQVY